MEPFVANDGWIGLAKQTASGAANYVAPSQYLYVDNFSMNPNSEPLIPNAEIGAGRDIQDNSVRVGGISWTGPIEGELRPSAIGLIILSAYGSAVSSGISGDAYGHTFEPTDNLIPLSITKRIGDESNPMDVFGYTDVKINTFRVEAAAGELATFSADAIAVEERSSKSDQTPTFETGPIFSFVDGKVDLEGISLSVKNISIELDNNIVDDDFRIGQRVLQSLIERRRTVTATIDTVPTDASIFKKTVFGGSANTSVSNTQQVYTGSLFLRFESPHLISSQPYSMDITVPKAVFRVANLPISGEDMVIETLEMTAVKQSGSASITTVLRNDVVSY